jgi:hypothetical protein
MAIATESNVINMISFQDAPPPWHTLRDFKPFLLREIKGSQQHPSEHYQKWSCKQGVYLFQVSGNAVVYIGMTNDGTKEGGLADRLYGLDSPRESTHRKLAEKGVSVRDCLVYVIEINETETRKVAKANGIAFFDPIGNR